MTAAAKRFKAQHFRDGDVEWRCTFDQTSGIRTLVEVVGNILTRINLRLIQDKKSGDHFLCIDSIDPQHVCMVQARLHCEKVEGLTEEVSFCVDSQLLNLCLKGIAAHYSLDLVKCRDSADVHIRAYETLSNSHRTCFTLPTIVDESETMQLNDMQYKYTIEIDLQTLRQIVKMSTSLRAETIDFSVQDVQGGATAGQVTRTAFTIGSRGDATQQHSFHSATVHEAGADSRVIRAATDASDSLGASDDKLVEAYKDSFSAQYLNLFLKAMDRSLITMKLSQDKPLIVNYQIDADKSYICFVLAPKQDDGDGA